MRAWIRRAASSARIAGERSDLWVPGALASLAFLGWIPFVLAVVPLPDQGDLGFVASQLNEPSGIPVRGLLLGVAVLVMVMVATLLVALGEAALLRGLDAVQPPRGSLARDAVNVWAVELGGMLPFVVTLILLAMAVAAAAPGEYQSPDAGSPFAMRVLADVWPWVALAILSALIGQAFGAVASRRVLREPISGALRGAARELVRRPAALVVTALATLGLYLAMLAASALLLHLLWAPIARSLSIARFGTPATPFLLVGFVSIWLCLLLASGALHAWTSGWWSAELNRDAADGPLVRSDHNRRAEEMP